MRPRKMEGRVHLRGSRKRGKVRDLGTNQIAVRILNQKQHDCVTSQMPSSVHYVLGQSRRHDVPLEGERSR